MKIIPIFAEHIIEFDYPDHEKYYEQWTQSILEKKYVNKKMKTTKLTFSDPNLHKKDEFNPLTEFMKDCIAKGMDEFGFIPDFSVTSMWYTVQNRGNYHQLHTHQNCFLAGLYYMTSKNKKAKGTQFISPNTSKYSCIYPKRNDKSSNLMQTSYSLDFIPGKVYVFPASIMHYTNPCEDDGRIIIGMNTMPYGFANTDPFDRYFYNKIDID